MSAAARWRVHAMHEAEPKDSGVRVYSDTGQTVAGDPHRPRGHGETERAR